MAVHSASWLLKYIPGQAGSLLNKLVWGKDKGFSRTLIVITFIYENIFLQLASIIPSEMDLCGAELELAGLENHLQRVRMALDWVMKHG